MKNKRFNLIIFVIAVLFIPCSGATSSYENQDTYFETPLVNSPTYLTLPIYTPETDMSVHPDLIYFPNSWNGYKYWMAFTPMPANYEFPSILVSQDGYDTWIEPPGISNPIVFSPNSRAYPDTDLFYNEDTDELWVYHIWNSDDGSNLGYLVRERSLHGINWTFEEILLTLSKEGISAAILSPSIVKVQSTYHLWYVVLHSDNSTVIMPRTSSNGTYWSDAENVNFLTSYNPWHLDVIYVPSKGEYWMIFPAYPPGGGFQVSSYSLRRA